MPAMKKSLVIAFLAAAPAVAHADTLVGAQLQIMPGGEVDGEGDFDGDLETAYGIAFTAEYPVHPNITIGLAPRIAFGIKLEDQDDGGIMLDIPVRVTGRFLVMPKLALYGFVAPGYSLIFPEDWPENASDPSGFIFGFGGGAAFRIGHNLALVGELGYTAGFHSSTVEIPLIDDEDVDVAHSYPHIGIGVQSAF
jgi:hypothetical protein